MPVTVDDQSLPADRLGLRTVGEVLSHLRQQNRLVVQVLVDGEEPDLTQMSALRARPLGEHSVYIETTAPDELATQILREVTQQLEQTDSLRESAVELLRQNQANRALEKLAGCFAAWHSAQQSVQQIAELLSIDLQHVRIDGQSLAEVLSRFAEQLRELRRALENRDYVLLGDVLGEDAADTTRQWIDAIRQLRDVIR